jgi:hypothetical protein
MVMGNSKHPTNPGIAAPAQQGAGATNQDDRQIPEAFLEPRYE